MSQGNGYDGATKQWLKVPKSIFKLIPILTGAEIKVLLFVVEKAEGTERRVTLTRKMIAEATGLHENHAWRAIDSLVEQEILVKESIPGEKGGYRNEYHLRKWGEKGPLAGKQARKPRSASLYDEDQGDPLQPPLFHSKLSAAYTRQWTVFPKAECRVHAAVSAAYTRHWARCTGHD